MTVSDTTGRKLKLLVCICSYGERHLEYLNIIIQTYRNMTIETDVVVLSEAPKDLGPGVRVVVGLPSKNPWSLPFSHKKIFADKLDDYDLFIYSEDDVEISEANIKAFLRAVPQLAPDEIPGFLLYEKDSSGIVWLNNFFSCFHWRPESVRRRGDYVVAEFTNVHSACYLLTQSQLRLAIASGGFLRGPCEGVYDLLCTAATDPYTNCGLRKVICISEADDFLVRHTPDKYTDQAYVSLADLKDQIHTLFDILNGAHPACTLFEIEPKFWHGWWQKDYYEEYGDEVLNMVPGDAKSILSIGCGWGATEARLKERGAEITALPLDSVAGVAAAHRGINVVYGTWGECVETLQGRKFDAVFTTNLLHLHPDPGKLLKQISQFVRKGGTLVLSGPNFGRIPWWFKRFFCIGEFRNLRSYDQSGINVCGPGTLARHLRNAGLSVTAVRWLDHSIGTGPLKGKQIPAGKLTAREWVLQAR
jgi:SAM-dependent methyltransferase